MTIIYQKVITPAAITNHIDVHSHDHGSQFKIMVEGILLPLGIIVGGVTAIIITFLIGRR